MPHAFNQILPSLQSLGLWTYWVVALVVMLEAIPVTGFFAPGGLTVIASGILVQQGGIDFFDLAWFVASGTVIGSEVSFYLGRCAAKGLDGREMVTASTHIRRARDLLLRYGGFALIVGRFLGPISASIYFSASVGGMPHRRYTAWNLASAAPYALGLPALGYFFGSAIVTMGAAVPRILVYSAGAILVVGFLWFLTARVRHAWPVLTEILASIAINHLNRPFFRRKRAQHPRVTAFIVARFDRGRFAGLTASVLALLFACVFAVWLDSVFDFVGDASVVQGDQRLANLLFVLRDGRLITFFSRITNFGNWKLVTAMLIGTTLALYLYRRFDLMVGLWLVVVGNQLSVGLMKHLFDRPRSVLGYFAASSGSFPSGHAASSVAIWGMMIYVLWRIRLLSATAAGLIAITAAFLIGLSRIYLIEHYLSDVLNGYLIGSLWLIFGIAVCEWREDRVRGSTDPRPFRQVSAVAVLLLASTVSVGLSFMLVTPRTHYETSAEREIVTSLSGAVDLARPLSVTESLLGAPRQQVNVAILTSDPIRLVKAMSALGWSEAPSPTLDILAQAFWKDWTGGALARSLVVPTFWRNRLDDLAFEREGPTAKVSSRLYLRLWRTHFQTAGGATAYFGTVEEDNPVEWETDDRVSGTGHQPEVSLMQLLTGLSALGIVGVSIP